LMKADACLGTGGERDPDDRPFCYTGAKGLLQMRLRASGANQALPPGMAASVANPLWRLLWALGQVKSDQEEVLIDGFYDGVDGPGPRRESVPAQPEHGRAKPQARLGCPDISVRTGGRGAGANRGDPADMQHYRSGGRGGQRPAEEPGGGAGAGVFS